MNSRSNILFDLDGTLIHSLPGIEEALEATLRSLGQNSSRREDFMPLVGYPLETVFARLLGEEYPYLDLAVASYRKFYMEFGLSQARPYEGIPEMLGTLYADKRPLFVVTARNEEVARTILRDHKINSYIFSVRGERQGDGRETKTDLLAEVLQDHQLDPSDTVMVGDRRFDIEAALLNGCLPVGVAYGYGTREELIESGAGIIVDTPADLANLLKNLHIHTDSFPRE